MYTIYVDDQLLYSPHLAKKGFGVINPKVTMETGKAGSASFVIPPDNEMYDTVSKMKSDIIIYQDNEEIFRGRVLDDKKDFYNRKNVHVEGELTYLLDSPTRPYSFQGDIPVFFGQLLANHNSHVDEKRQFRLGNVTVTDPNNYINRSNSNYSNTSNEIRDKIIKTHGGFLRVRRSNGHRYLDLIADYEMTSDQTIEFGVNLLDISQYITAKDVYTCLIPVGAVLDEETGERLTIEDVNGGKDYLENEAGIELFGRIWKVKEWDDVTLPTNLYRKGVDDLKENIKMSVSLEIKAVDMHLLNVDTQRIRVGQKIRVISKPHGIDEYFDCTKITLDLANPGKSVYTLGATHTTITDQQSTTAKSSMTVADMAQAAVDSATSAAQSAQAAVTQVAGKQDKLVAGDNITIDPVTNVISSTGGSSVVVDDTISGTSENPVQNKVLKAALDLKQDKLTAGSNITIDPVTNVICATVAVHYSTDEQVIGTWIDGGTLYEKTITASISNRVQWIDTGVDNTSTIVYSEGFLEHSVGITTLASADPDGQAGINTFVQSVVTTGKWSVLYRAKQEHTFLHAGDLTVTIRYTKSS